VFVFYRFIIVRFCSVVGVCEAVKNRIRVPFMFLKYFTLLT